MAVDACECAANWRIELTDLLTGAIRHSITPTQFEFETSFLEAGRGNITFNRRGVDKDTGPQFVSVNDMEPYSTGIFFSRVNGGAATPANPIPMFGGFIETMDSDSAGMATLGFSEMQKYLDFRMIRSDLVFSADNQNSIGANLVLYARGDNFDGGSVDPSPTLGIPLIGVGGTTAFNRDRTYLAVDRPMIGEMIRNLTQIEDGPVYSLEHSRGAVPGLTDGWSSVMTFEDTWQQVSIPRITWQHLTDLKVFLDGNGIANQIDAFGDPEEDGTPRIATADSPFSFRPRFDAAPAFSGVSNLTTLGQHAVGYQNDYRDPALNLQLFLSGLEYGQAAGSITLTLDDLVPGNEVNLNIHSPNWVVEAGVDFPSTMVPSVGRVSVAAGQEGPEQVAAQIIVDSFPSNVLSSQPADCEDC